MGKRTFAAVLIAHQFLHLSSQKAFVRCIPVGYALDAYVQLACSSSKLKCTVQGDTSEVKQKRDMLLQEGVMFDSDNTIANVCVIAAADLEQSYLNRKEFHNNFRFPD